MTKRDPIQIAADKWLGDPLVIEAIAYFDKRGFSVVTDLVLASFVEGANYAASRCEAAGHKHGDKDD